MNSKYVILLPAFFLLGMVSIAAQGYYMSLNYSMTAPMGETQDYIGNFSWRGFNVEGHWFLQSKLSLGFHTGWNAFYEKTAGDFVEDTRTISGTQLRYINAMPILVDGRYHLGDEESGMRPYFGLGVGTISIWQRTEMGIFVGDSDNWHFAIAPAAGLLVPLGSFGDSVLHLGLRYNYALQANDSPTHSWLGINVGIAWMQ